MLLVLEPPTKGHQKTHKHKHPPFLSHLTSQCIGVDLCSVMCTFQIRCIDTTAGGDPGAMSHEPTRQLLKAPLAAPNNNLLSHFGP